MGNFIGFQVFKIQVDSRKFFNLVRENKYTSGRPFCPKCKYTKIKVLRKKQGQKFYYCPRCRRDHKNPYFNDLTGTAFEGLRISIEKIVLLMMCFCENNSALQSMKSINGKFKNKISYSTVWKVFHIFRNSIAKNNDAEEIENDVWELDEVYVGCRHQSWKGLTTKRTMRERMPIKRGRGSDFKVCVLNMVSRFDTPKQIKFKVIEHVSSEAIQEAIQEKLGKTPFVAYSDEFRSYRYLKKETRHRPVNHHGKNLKSCAKGGISWTDDATGAHTNTVESWHSFIRFSWAKYRMIGAEYLEKYLHEFYWKFRGGHDERGLLRVCLS